MDINKYSKELQCILQQHQKIRETFKDKYHFTDMDISEFDIPKVDLAYFMICTEPESMCFGKGVGVFVYKEESVFHFHYDIKPDEKHPGGYMTDIYKLCARVKHGEVMLYDQETSIFIKAFWNSTPADCLENDENACRHLMKMLENCCIQHNIPDKFEKNNDAHENWNSAYHARLMLHNSVYGVTGKTGDNK